MGKNDNEIQLTESEEKILSKLKTDIKESIKKPFLYLLMVICSSIVLMWSASHVLTFGSVLLILSIVGVSTSITYKLMNYVEKEREKGEALKRV